MKWSSGRKFVVNVKSFIMSYTDAYNDLPSIQQTNIHIHYNLLRPEHIPRTANLTKLQVSSSQQQIMNKRFDLFIIY